MLRFITAGESHGPCLTALIEGLPAGLPIDLTEINNDLFRRQQGVGRGGRMKIEKDQAEILSGVRFGETLGSPLTIRISNKDWENWQQTMPPFGEKAGNQVTAPRPGHADLSGCLKYERHDARDILERASARETATRVAVGAIAKQLLRIFGMSVHSHVIRLGCMDQAADREKAVEKARETGDTLGGLFEITVQNVIVGLGSHVHWDRRIDGRIAGAVMSIPAIKGVEIGTGFALSELLGSRAHDEIFYRAGQGYYRQTNRAGGIEGGITNGEPIIVRAAMKPIPTLMQPLATVDMLTKEVTSANRERSDVSAVDAAAVVGEAMVAIVLADSFLEKFGGDSLEDLRTAVEHYRRRIS
jgi:chorismate synthase